MFATLIGDPASTLVASTRPLTWSLIGLSTIFCMLVFGSLIWFCWRYRKGSSADRSNPPQKSTLLEVLWIGVPLLLAIGIFSWSADLYALIFSPPKDAAQVYVLGKQWMWKIYHPEGPSEIDTLHLARGRPIVVTLASQDVVHDFYIPDFHIKMDAVPGKFTQIWFQPMVNGTFWIFCAQFCGTNHALMRGKVVVSEPAEYEAWLQQNSNTSLPVKGEAIFNRLGCASCHQFNDASKAPPLYNLYGHYEILDSGRRAYIDDDYFRRSIMEPASEVVRGYAPIMPSFAGQIHEEELIALIAYIHSLKREGVYG